MTITKKFKDLAVGDAFRDESVGRTITVTEAPGNAMPNGRVAFRGKDGNKGEIAIHVQGEWDVEVLS